ncbi:MAG: ScyD/ScyE family protein [Chloroflexota bacterium]
MVRRIGAAGLAIGLSIAAVAPAMAQDSSPAASGAAGPWSVVVQGLDAPRGLAIGADGTLYVAEAGAGGDQCMETERGKACAGMTSGISAIKDGAATKVVSGLVSIATGEGAETEILGTADVALDADGNLYFPTPLGGSPDFRATLPEPVAAVLGRVWKQATDGTLTEVADLAAFEAASNPDSADPGTQIDSDPNSVAIGADGTIYAADAGGNDVLAIAPDGTVSTVAVFPATMVPAPPDPTKSPDPSAAPAMMPMQSVPTNVIVGPDGALYVSTLTGFPFPVGGAAVYKVVPGQDPVVYGTGLTMAMDLAFAPDGTLYVAEIAKNGLLSGDPTGALMAIPAGGGAATEIPSEGLMLAGGVAVGADGTVYVSTGTVIPGGGSIVAYKP